MDLNILVQRIGYFRNRKKLSARELSLRIGKSETYINQVECRNFNISLPALLEIVEVLGISCAEFFSDNYADYERDKEMLELFKDLPVERKNSFIDLMKHTN